MCDPITAAIAAVTVIAGGLTAYGSIQTANAQKKQAKYEAQLQEKQLYRQREMQRLASLEQENGRAAEFNAARSSAMAAIGASGLGEHISFFQSIDPEAQKSYLRDVRRIRLNMLASDASIADQVSVTEFRKDTAIFNANVSKVGAIADFMKTAMSAASFYSTNSTPAKAGGH